MAASLTQVCAQFLTCGTVQLNLCTLLIAVCTNYIVCGHEAVRVSYYSCSLQFVTSTAAEMSSVQVERFLLREAKVRLADNVVVQQRISNRQSLSSDLLLFVHVYCRRKDVVFLVIICINSLALLLKTMEQFQSKKKVFVFITTLLK